MRFLVTGGAGFIGSHLCNRLLNDNHDVICLDNFNTYYDPEIKRNNIQSLQKHPRFHLVEESILNPEGLDVLFEEQSVDAVVHLAARAGVRPSIQNPGLYQKVNVEGTLNLLERSVHHQVSRFVMASSSSVYGKNEKVPFSESDNVDNPISPYAATKKACELLAYTYHHLHGLPVSCLRFFTVYGPRQRPDMAIYKFTRGILKGEAIPVYGDGSSRRDYTFFTDIIDGIMRSIEHCRGYHIYNLGESKTVELRYLISLIEKAAGKTANIQRLPEQPGDVPITYADISRARKELGYAPCVTIEEGIPRFVEWFMQERPEG